MEREILVHDVVIDRFRDSDHALLKTPAPDLGVNPRPSLQCSITADDEEDIDTEFFQVIHHFTGVLRTS